MNINEETPLLTEREIEIINLLAKGLTNKQISDKLFISPHTIKANLEHIYQKLGVINRIQTIVLAYKKGILNI